ncbi:DUF6334 family protein [Floridanema evergladense]|uniref:DUF6334 family protein n=1 Tax=Floridaenema evergladense BLCC-F167 TaxID=3153639 RepID=A0ABV4WKL1_9CYAN
MVEDEFDFPIGKPLISMSVWESKEFSSNELWLEKVKLIFQDQELILQPIADTDEIEIIVKPKSLMPINQVAMPTNPMVMEELVSSSKRLENHIWYNAFIGKKLQTVWVCENSQGYRDQIILAFQHLHPSVSFVAEGSVIKVFSLEQIKQKKISITI